MQPLVDGDPVELGRYQVRARVGTGGMGVVYLAIDDSGRQVAIKLIRPELADDPAFRSRFRREVHAGQKVSGIRTATYIDADPDGARPYVVTEYVDGPNLSELVAERGPVDHDQLAGLAVGLAEALVAMGSVDVVHRDLKPSNVLMADSGPKVVDFGIAHAADVTALTQAGALVGSPSWLSPEQALGQDVGPGTDVFAWGALVAFAGTGRPPFGGGRPEAVVYRVVHEEPDLQGLDPRLAPIVSAALTKDPRARPRAEDLLIAAVRAATPGAAPSTAVATAAGSPRIGAGAQPTAVIDRTSVQKPPAVAPVGGPPLRQRRRLRWALAAAVVLVAAAGSGVGVALAGHNRNHGPPAPSTSYKRAATPTTTSPSSAPAASSTPSSPPPAASDVISVVECPTRYGISGTPPSVVPDTIATSISPAVASQLSFYSDSTRSLAPILGPKGWDCAAGVGADGGVSISVAPPGTDLSSQLSSDAQAVVADANPACQGCVFSDVCALDPNADLIYQGEYQCSSTVPPQEGVDWLDGSPTTVQDSPNGTSQALVDVIAFEDPPGVSGDGYPSGGPYPANGIVEFSAEGEPGDAKETCTLPANNHDLCTATLNDFVTRDWGSLP